LNQHIPECRELWSQFAPAFTDYWFQGKTPPDEMWKPSYLSMTDKMKEARKSSNRVVLSHATGAPIARDFIREQLGEGTVFIELYLEKSVLYKQHKARFESDGQAWANEM